MDMDAGLFGQIMKLLWDFGNYAHRHATGALRELYDDHVQIAFRRLIWSETELEWLLPGKGRPISGGVSKPYLLMEPITKGGLMLPLISWMYDPDAKPTAKLGFHLALCMLSKNDGLFSVGYRFESPHGTGMHNYYHVQLIRRFADGMPSWCDECRDSLPETQPAFAIDARDPVSLLICILVSVYGLDHFSRRVTQAPFWNELRPYYLRMACNDFQPA